MITATDIMNRAKDKKRALKVFEFYDSKIPKRAIAKYFMLTIHDINKILGLKK